MQSIYHFTAFESHNLYGIFRGEAYMYVFVKRRFACSYISTMQGSKTKHTQARMSTWTDTHWTDFVQAQLLASRKPVTMPMFGGQYAASPLLCFSLQSLSYLEVHCCHKAERREKHGRAWWSSITNAQAWNLHRSNCNNRISYYIYWY